MSLTVVDPVLNTITCAGNTFTNGESIVYQLLSTLEIGSLSDGFRYTIQQLSQNTFQLLDPTNSNAVVTLTTPTGPTVHELVYSGATFSFTPLTAVNAATDAIDPPNNGLTSGQVVVYETDPTISKTKAVQVQQVLNFEIGALDSSTNQIYLPLHGFNTGDLVTFQQLAGSDPLAQLTNNGQYEVNVIDDNDFPLLNPVTSVVIPLSQGTSTGTYSFTDGVRTQTLALVNTSTNIVTLAGNPFSNGETVVYTALSGLNIGSLASDSHYIIHTSSPSSFQFLDPANGNAVVALSSVPTGTTLYALAYATPAGDTLHLSVPDAAIGGPQVDQVYYVVSVDKDHIRLAKD